MSVKSISTSRPVTSALFTCAHCKTTREKMDHCSRCRFTYYCNVECQKAHWPQHQLQCKKREDNKEIEIIDKTAKKILPSSSFNGPFFPSSFSLNEDDKARLMGMFGGVYFI